MNFTRRQFCCVAISVLGSAVLPAFATSRHEGSGALRRLRQEKIVEEIEVILSSEQAFRQSGVH